MLALLRPSLVGDRGSLASGCRLGRLTVLCPRLRQFVSQPGAITIGAVECAVEASIFALQSLDFGNDVSFYLHHFSLHCVSGIVGDFELAT